MAALSGGEQRPTRLDTLTGTQCIRICSLFSSRTGAERGRLVKRMSFLHHAIQPNRCHATQCKSCGVTWGPLRAFRVAKGTAGTRSDVPLQMPCATFLCG